GPGARGSRRVSQWRVAATIRREALRVPARVRGHGPGIRSGSAKATLRIGVGARTPEWNAMIRGRSGRISRCGLRAAPIELRFALAPAGDRGGRGHGGTASPQEVHLLDLD